MPLKKEFEKFINLIYKSYKYSEDENFDQNNLLLIFANFFETTYCCTHIPDNDKYQDSNYESWEKDHTKLLIHELFLYLINFFLEKSEYQLVYQFLNIDFDFIENEYYNADYKGFPVFSFNLSKESCPLFTVNKHHRKKYKIRELLNTFRKRISLDRNIRNQGLLKTDLLLYYLSLLYDKKFDRKWFPRIYLTGCEKEVLQIREIKFLESDLRFEKIKDLYEIDKLKDLEEKLNNSTGKDLKDRPLNQAVPDIKKYIIAEN